MRASGYCFGLGWSDTNPALSVRRQCLDNVFVERLWWSVKYEDVYLRGYGSVPESERGLRAYFEFYSEERLPQSLGYKTPGEAYRAGRGGRKWRRRSSNDSPVAGLTNRVHYRLYP